MYRIISCVAVILWAVLIFSLSHQPAVQSSQLSAEITEIIVEKVERVSPKVEFTIGRLHHIVRKNAHFFLYLVFIFLVMNALRRSGMHGYRMIGISLLVCVLYAISDEVHQLFVLGRGALVKDVLIDSTGAIVGVGLYLVISRIMKSRSTRLVIKD
jgi:VanZ family protein